MSTGRLEGRVAIITGAARGQGAAEAELFAAEGAQVVVADVLDDEGQDVARRIGSAAVYHHLDVRSEDGWHSVVAATEQRLGKIDIVVNNAGITQFGPMLDTSLADYMSVIEVNQVGCFLGLVIGGAALARAGGGSIVNISSTAGLEGTQMCIAYTASKHAITGMTKTAAIELGPLGIRVNSVHPGGVDTAMIGLTDEARATGFGFLPVGRVAEPAEIAKAVLFLASDDSSYCTGTSLLIDGGSLAGPLNWQP